MTPEERAILETPYASSYITGNQLRQQYGHQITSPGNFRGKDEQEAFLRKGLALKLPGQSSDRQQ